jgi:hypothetical protein
MSVVDLLIIVCALAGLAVLRFGVPILMMWLFNLVCCRVLHLTP